MDEKLTQTWVLLIFMIKVKKIFLSRAKEIFLSGAFSLREARYSFLYIDLILGRHTQREREREREVNKKYRNNKKYF